MQVPRIPMNESERLAEVISLNLSGIDKKEQFDNIVYILSTCLKVPIAYISSIENKHQKIHASCGISFDSSDRSTSFCGHTILQNEVLVIEDTLKDSRFADNPLVVNNPKIRFYAGYPLTSLLGNNVGSLCIADTVPRKLTKKEFKVFNDIGSLLTERLRMLKLGDLQDQLNDSRKRLELYNRELKKNNSYYIQLFGQYMSDSLLEKITSDLENTNLDGEEKFVTIMMSDLRGFSAMSEKYDPAIIVKILNIYFEEMIDIIHNYNGYINEILGDGILVVFGAPKQVGNCAEKAIFCAQDMQKGLIKVNKKLKKLGFPELKMGIGVNSGNVVVGNIGSKKRMKYGVIGETVNIASRIESYTIPSQILISETTFENVKDFVKPIGNIRTKLKGSSKEITIYDVS